MNHRTKRAETGGEMAATITEQTVLALEMVKKEGITEPIDAVLATILEQMGFENERCSDVFSCEGSIGGGLSA
jgi:hypothetical protein